MVQVVDPALRREWDRLMMANCRFPVLEAAMRARALLELSEGVPTLELLELAAERAAPPAPRERPSFGREMRAADVALRQGRSS